MTESDTTEHIPELEKLREMSEELVSPDLYVRILESLPDALIVANDRGEIVMFNGQAELLFGYHRLEVLRQPLEVLLPEPMRQRHREHRNRYMADPRVRPMGSGMTLRGLHKSGREFSIEINLSPIISTTGIYVSAVVRRQRE